MVRHALVAASLFCVGCWTYNEFGSQGGMDQTNPTVSGGNCATLTVHVLGSPSGAISLSDGIDGDPTVSIPANAGSSFDAHFTKCLPVNTSYNVTFVNGDSGGCMPSLSNGPPWSGTVTAGGPLDLVLQCPTPECVGGACGGCLTPPCGYTLYGAVAQSSGFSLFAGTGGTLTSLGSTGPAGVEETSADNIAGTTSSVQAVLALTSTSLTAYVAGSSQTLAPLPVVNGTNMTHAVVAGNNVFVSSDGVASASGSISMFGISSSALTSMGSKPTSGNKPRVGAMTMGVSSTQCVYALNADTNIIDAFTVAIGQLTPVGATGTGGVVGSAAVADMTFVQTGQNLMLVNLPGSGSIATFTINSNCSLTPAPSGPLVVAGSSFPTSPIVATNNGFSLAYTVANQRVYGFSTLPNAGANPHWLVPLGASGSTGPLTPDTVTTIKMDQSSQGGGGQGAGLLFYATTNSIGMYKVDTTTGTGSLTAMSGAPPSVNVSGPVWFSGYEQSGTGYLYVVNNDQVYTCVYAPTALIWGACTSQPAVGAAGPLGLLSLMGNVQPF